MVKYIALAIMAVTGIMGLAFGEDHPGAHFQIGNSLDVAEVPTGFPVRFCLLTDGRTQYVAYYDKHRRMTIASRTLDSNKWRYQVLPSKVGWGSHNYIAMAMDDDGCLHVSGNMHCVPLIYFRMDEKTLHPVEKTISIVPEYPKDLNQTQSDFKGMGVQRAKDISDSGDEEVRYILQWETLGRNRDRPRKSLLPKPSTLRVCKLRTNDEIGTAKEPRATDKSAP